MALEDDIKQAEIEEMQSKAKYRTMADEAERGGMHDMARMMRGVADDEGTHAMMMREMMHGSKQGVVPFPDRGMMTDMGFGGKVRSFPKVYGDWVDIAEDIKQAEPPDAIRVNIALESISNDDPTAEESKRWLMQRAGELGIN